MSFYSNFCKVFTVTLLLNATAYGYALDVVTEEFPPFQYLDKNKKVQGMATEVVRLVLKEAGIKTEIRMYPWARAYKRALQETNVLIYSIARTREREHHFKWIGTITPYSVYLWKLKKRKDIQINKIEQAKQYLTGGVPKDVKLDYLLEYSFEVGDHLILSKSDVQNLIMLANGRIDLTPFDEIAFSYSVKKLGYNLAEFERAFYIEELSSELYMALSILTPDDLVYTLRKALEKVKERGQYEAIRQKYLNNTAD
ncbi:substrate-binding periplasmic protein [Zooshikella harenae]|uniref:Transporter substrate-binding domain-containing protein n=1 Tax=Zooshikella harenae TaxID=2827238 RepID=A0ABS5ZAV3_9GAMM|nr:transporter substrate-binding domain-containing protein [Zooshikella harenae]MBU2711187.1 transporter substrate-binding domain-containing protein [Zooshikella harenae]